MSRLLLVRLDLNVKTYTFRELRRFGNMVDLSCVGAAAQSRVVSDRRAGALETAATRLLLPHAHTLMFVQSFVCLPLFILFFVYYFYWTTRLHIEHHKHSRHTKTHQEYKAPCSFKCRLFEVFQKHDILQERFDMENKKAFFLFYYGNSFHGSNASFLLFFFIV